MSQGREISHFYADEKTPHTKSRVLISCIAIAEKLRGKGLFTKLLQYISSIDYIMEIQIMFITNERFDSYLERLGWTRSAKMDRMWRR